jgi:preprotein translocase subunit SecF
MKAVKFIEIRFVAIGLSILLIAGGLINTFVFQKGFNFSVDFKGGLNYTVTFQDKNLTVDQINDAVQSIGKVEVKSQGTAGSGKFAIRLESNLTEGSNEVTTLDEKQAERITSALLARFGETAFDKSKDVAVEFVGPVLASRSASSSVIFGAIALLLIFAYAWFRFKFAYAMGAILALVHDTLFMLGFIGTFRVEFSVSTIAAILTIIGYSINDTIVVFDRIRENVPLIKDQPLGKVINISITQSLSRTIMTSLTTFIAILPMYIFATGSIKNFALNFIVGIVVGTYSSIFIASPIFYAIHNLEVRRAAKKEAGKLVPKKA